MIFFLVSFFSAVGTAKTIQPEADYYEDGNHAPMCMMCHMVVQPPTNATLNLSTNRTSLLPGEQAAITVTRSNFGANWKPGIVLQMSHGDAFAQRAPKDYGWQLTNPKSNPFNYSVWDNTALTSLSWVFQAPKMPGQYQIATSAYFNDGGTSLDTLGKPGTKRGNNTLTITVGRVAESQKPQLLAVAALYKIYVMLKFSEPVEASSALSASNYQITKVAGGQSLSVSQVFQSRDETVVFLKTPAQDPSADYSVTVRNVRDYASTPNTIDAASKTFRQDLTIPYKFTCMLAQDVTQTAFMWYDHYEFLGRDSAGAMNRVNMSFIITPITNTSLDKPMDMLSDIPFDSAKLRYRVSGTPSVNASPTQWDLYRISTSQGIDPMDPLSTHWSGYNQAGTPVATLARQVTLVQNGLPETWWEWDITQDFRTAYTAKQRGMEFRLKARTENTSTGGVGFYGHDHDTVSFRPHIALTFRQAGTAGESRTLQGQSLKIEIAPNPVSSEGRIFSAGSENFEIHSLSGALIKRWKNTAQAGSWAWNALNVPPGVYLATARGPAGVARLKVTVIR